MSNQFSQSATATWLIGGGEMGALMRAFDWSKTPVGAIASWSPSLRTTVSLLLASRYPMTLIWGPDLIQFYNDGYMQLLGSKHPSALGRPHRETFPEVLDTVGPMIESVMTTGVPNWEPEQLLVLEREGYLEECYFTLSYSPACDEMGQIAGMLCVCSETTQKVLGERRLRLLRDLASRTSEARTLEVACQDITDAIAEHPFDVPFALIYLREPDGTSLALQGAVGLTQGTANSPLKLNLEELGTDTWSLKQAASGETILVEKLGSHQLPGGPWEEPSHSALVLPIPSSNQEPPIGVLVVGISPRRALDEGYRSFFELLAGQIALAITNAQAYEQERKRAESLAELDRAKTTFFSNVSHEFRTPLTLMLRPVEDALADTDDPLSSKQRERLELLQRNGLRLLKLVNTLLDFSRIEAGRIQAVYEPTDLATLTTDLASVFRSVVEQAGLQLIVDCPKLPEPIYVDREMWEKIILNLLSNAFKFTFEGAIAVRLYSVDDCVELTVQDTGIGIPTEELPHLFERFHRVKGARGRTFEGSGIGLSLVQELVRLHGGTVHVTSVLGEGSTFTVKLPKGYAHLPSDSLRRGEAYHVAGYDSALRLDAEATQTSTASGAISYVKEALGWVSHQGSRQDTGSRTQEEVPSSSPHPYPWARILLVEDNADMRDYLRRLLQQYYEVEAVADGHAALAAVRASVPDLVLSDVMMPGLDGFGLLRELRDDPQTREIPILLLSARAGEEAAVEGLAAGADDYLVKPFSARELLARVATNLKLGQSRREAAHRRIHNILESITDAFYAVDYNWHFTYINRRAEQLWGKQRQELLGKSIWEMFPQAVGSEAYQAHQQAVREQRTISLETQSPVLHSWIEMNIYPSQEGLAVYFQDISDRKRAEQERDQFRTQTERFFNLSVDMVCIANFDGYFTRVNPAFEKVLGYTTEELLSTPFFDFIHPEDLEATTAELQQISIGYLTLYFENRYRCKDGSYKWLAWASSPVLEEGVIYAVARDITEKRRTEASLRETAEKLTQANRIKDEFLAVLSHELRTPLNPILGWTRLLQAGKLDEKKTAFALETIERNTKLQAQLIEDLLDVSRILQGKLRLKISPVNLVTMIEAARETVRLAAEAKSIQIQTVFDSAARQVKGDSNRLQQVVWNLLSNAVKFTPTGGQIEIKLERIGSYAQIQVKDTGEGICAEFLPYIFEYFRQADGSITRRFGGLGLGLAIARHLVELHGGTIYAESPGQGQGATFTVRLPLLKAKGTQQEAKGDFCGSSFICPPLEGIRVLVVDDEPDTLNLLVFVLEQAGAIVTSAASASLALEAFKQQQPDLLLSDIAMPEMDGYTLI
ncbi:MAG: ATP-binding protein, partial [Cyanobacteriota bacterium]